MIVVKGFLNVGVIILADTAKHNRLSHSFSEQLIEAINELSNEYRVIILRAPLNTKIWCVGHDIKEFAVGRDPLPAEDSYEQLLHCIQHCPRPIIAMIEGSVWGGGCELALTCDMAIASDNSQFAITPAKIGLPYNINGLKRYLNALPLAHIKELFFSAQPISAQRAAQINLINHCVPVEELENFVYTLAKNISENSPEVITNLKQQLLLLNDRPLTSQTMATIEQSREDIYNGANFAEGLTAFFEKRIADFK